MVKNIKINFYITFTYFMRVYAIHKMHLWALKMEVSQFEYKAQLSLSLETKLCVDIAVFLYNKTDDCILHLWERSHCD